MASQILKDKSGRVIGRIDEEGGKYVLKDRSGKRLGYYNPKTDKTFDKSGKSVGKGNLLDALLVNQALGR